MTSPLVSVCIPAFRADRFILNTLKSVERQSYGNWELIVTEDGSNGKTANIVKSFSEWVSQPVIYNRHEENRGLPETRNTGIATARGEWIAFLDSDDFWEEDHLAALVRTASKGVDMVFSGFKRYDDESAQYSDAIVPTPALLENLGSSLFQGTLSIMPSSVMIHRSAFSKFGLISADYPHTNDTEYWLRILRNKGIIRFSGTASCIYRTHGASMSRRIVELMEDSARVCEQYANWTAIPWKVKRKRPAKLYRLAARLAEPNDQSKAYFLLRKALKIDPLNLKTLLAFPRLLVRAASRDR
jgi:glycosyltransferase involved in cell wall biosynthesis